MNYRNLVDTISNRTNLAGNILTTYFNRNKIYGVSLVINQSKTSVVELDLYS